MKKKLLFFSLAFASVFAFAGDISYNWHQVLQTNDSVRNKTQSTCASLSVNSDNDIFTTSTFGSRVDASNSFITTEEYFGRTFTGAAYNTSSSYGKNLVITKITASGELLWAVSSCYGDISKSNITPASDGGLFVALKLRSTDSYSTDNNKLVSFVDENNDTITIDYAGKEDKRIYLGIIMKIDNSGAIESVKKIDMDFSPQPNATSSVYMEYTPDGFDFYGIAADDNDNIYICGNQRVKMTVDSNTIMPNGASSWNGDSQISAGNGFILKMDKNLSYVSCSKTEGGNKYEKIKAIKYRDGNLYYAGQVTSDSISHLSFGGKTIATTASKNLFCGEVSETGVSKWISLINGIETEGKNTPMLANINIGKDAFYIVGRVQGSLGYINGVDTVLFEGGKKYNQYVLSVDKENGKGLYGYVEKSSSITNALSVISNDDSVYVYNYKLMGGAYLDAYSKDLANIKRDTLISAGTLVTAWDAAGIGDTLVFMSRAKKSYTVCGEEEVNHITSAYCGSVVSVIMEGRSFTSSGSLSSVDPVIVADDNLSVYSAGLDVVINNVEKGERIMLFDILGNCINSKIASDGENILSVNNSGVYILKAGNKAVKVSVSAK